jgi:ATP-dependent DNA helicase RecG
LQAAAGIRDREHFRSEYLEPLILAGLLERTIPDKPTSSKQKYQLTRKGWEFIAKLAKNNKGQLGEG